MTIGNITKTKQILIAMKKTSYKYVMASYGICRFLQIGFLIGILIATAMMDDTLRMSCKVFVYIGSGLVFFSSAFFLTWHVLKPSRKHFAATKWQEGLHDGLSALVMLVVSTVLLMQDLNISIGIAVFLSLSCALCYALQGFSNYSAGRQERIKEYHGHFQVTQHNNSYGVRDDDQVILSDDEPSGRNFTITSNDEDDQALPTITIDNPNVVDKALLLDANRYKDTLRPSSAASTPGASDRSGVSEYNTPLETPTGQNNSKAAAGFFSATAAAGVVGRPYSPTTTTATTPTWNNDAFYSPADKRRQILPSNFEKEFWEGVETVVGKSRNRTPRTVED